MAKVINYKIVHCPLLYFLFRMLTRLQVDDELKVKGRILLEVFEFETKAEGLPAQNILNQVFFAPLLKIYPNVVKQSQTNSFETITIYIGIKIKPTQLDQCTGFSGLCDL